MNYPLYNNSNLDLNSVQNLFDSFLPFAERYLDIPKCPVIHLVSDQENSLLPLGKTGFYSPNEQKITIFTDNRHIKDILRSLSHELVHHKQNLQGMFDGAGFAVPGYAQNDQHLRGMEREAYEKGNLCLRDWEDKHKKQLQESIYTIKGDNFKMSYKNWRNQEVNNRLMESWGFKAPKNEISHLCAMLVTEKATGRVGHPINHTLLESGTVTHYDVEFDDVIVERLMLKFKRHTITRPAVETTIMTKKRFAKCIWKSQKNHSMNLLTQLLLVQPRPLASQAEPQGNWGKRLSRNSLRIQMKLLAWTI